ncbi:uncharacterized sodium-dependent transporter YhdH-like [Ptychodera flava]|uniref:uncharacterized sodium-dependent transporter YhdH-like n=1 Tax=Ptychodera flava TaxID=63121 RepID=UPI00396AAC68
MDSETTPLKKDDEKAKGSQYSSGLSMVLSSLGCVVGTGNIWRFPRIVANNSGENGSLQFLIVWLMFSFLWSIPMVLIEYPLGRCCKTLANAYRSLIGPKNLWCSGWLVLVTTFITCYYAVLVGWCLYYSFYFMVNPLPVRDYESKQIFFIFSEQSCWPIVLQILVVLAAGLSLLTSVRGIEIVNNIMVPILFILVLVTFVWAMTVKNAVDGLKFMFSPDWGLLLSAKTWLEAITQNAWDVGAGQGIFVAYGAYMTAANSVVRVSTLIPLADNLVSLICAMTTFSTVFGIEINEGYNKTEIVTLLKTNGPGNTGLTFIWMPILYSTASFGRVLAVVFFFALFFAGFTSLIGMMELPVQTVEGFGVKRSVSVIVCVILVCLFGCPSALNINFLVDQDFVWGYALLISGLLLQYLVIRYGTAKFRSSMVNDYTTTSDWYLPKLWEWVVKFVAPTEAVFLLAWFVVFSVLTDSSWYTLGVETLMMCLLQWSLVLAGVVLANIIYYYRCVRHQDDYRDIGEQMQTFSSE